MSKTSNSLAGWAKKKEKTLITKIRNKNEIILILQKKKNYEHYAQLYTNKLDNLDETNS